MKLNIGSGTIRLEGFLNVDHRANAGADVIDDGFVLATIEPNSVEEIVASHILEHACFDRTQGILKRWREVLVPGGKLWVAVPNFALVLGMHHHNLLAGKITWEYFNSRIFGNAQVAREMYGDAMLEEMPGVHQYEMAFHRAVFTPLMLAGCLHQALFEDVQIVDAIPGKKKHDHEVVALAVK